MREIFVLLRQSIPVEPNFPPSLNELARLTTNASLFICPSTREKPADMPNVEQWSDFIYVANLPDLATDKRLPVLISPPENHGGKYGYVVWLTGEVVRLPSSDIRKLIAEPWHLATDAPPREADQWKNKAQVRLPARFRKLYPNAYRAGSE